MSLINLIDFIFIDENIDTELYSNIKYHRVLDINKNIFYNFVFLAEFKENTYHFHLFKRIFNLEERTNYINKGKYLASFFLSNEEFNEDNEFHINNIRTYNDNLKNLDNLIKINNTIEQIEDEMGSYQMLFNPALRAMELIQDYDEFYNNCVNLDNPNLLSIMKNMETGIYTNINDVRWNVYLSNLIISYYTNGKLVKHFRSNQYMNIETSKFYFPNFEPNNRFDKSLYKSINFLCDSCGVILNKHDKLWHNFFAGDLCQSCYLNKRNYENKRKLLIKKKLLLFSKKIIFLRDLEKTKKLLSSIELPILSLERKYSIQKNVIAEISKSLFSNNRRTCPICFDLLNDNLSTGKCGHVFHTSCIESLLDHTCPLCKTDTEFVKLYLYN